MTMTNNTETKKRNSHTITNDICQRVTDRLVALMESGVNPWRKPWGGCGAALSRSTGKPYSLINQMLLEFRPGEYATFAQIKKEGGRVKKGAKSIPVVFWMPAQFKTVKPETPENTDGEDDEDIKTLKWQGAILKTYNVFNLEDCEGIEPKHYKPGVPVKTFDPVGAAEDVINDYLRREGVTLTEESGDRAFYRPSTDSVTLPKREQFHNANEFYSTAFHELGHSTGHSTRLNRLEKAVFGDKVYSREELVAEITAAISCAELGINTDRSEENSAAYLTAWAQFLKSDPRAIVVAAGKAEKAFQLIFDKKAVKAAA